MIHMPVENADILNSRDYARRFLEACRVQTEIPGGLAFRLLTSEDQKDYYSFDPGRL